MINTDMRIYNYQTYGEENEYGQPVLSDEIGTVKMVIHSVSEAVADNALYSDAQFVGLTLNKAIDTTYVIHYGEDKLKVLYVIPDGRYRQVFMARM